MTNLYSRILVAYDGSKLSEKALEHAIAMLERSEQIELDVATVYDVPKGLEGYGLYNEGLLKDFRAGTEKMMEKVEQQLKDANIPNKVRTYVLEGNPAKVLVDFANERDTDMIVMGSRGLSGLQEVFLGSVSNYVVQHANCPVFIVK